MKKIIVLLLCIISIVSVFLYVFFKSNVNLKHFKQSNIKCNGTIYTKGENEVYLETFFIDENLNSEMESNNNIKEIYVIDKKGERLKIRDTNLEVEYKSKNDFLIRVLKSTIELNKNKEQIKEEYWLDKMVIKYIDGKQEIFNLGELKINTLKNNANKLAYYSYQELVMTNINDEMPSGIIVKLGKLDYEKIILKDIDLGLEGIEVDYQNIKVLNKYNSENQEDYNKVNNIKVAIENEEKDKFNGLELNFRENEMARIVVPFKINKDFKKKNIIYIVNSKLVLEANEIKEILIGDVGEKSFNIKEDELKIQLETEGI